jgi:hypothetical protein
MDDKIQGRNVTIEQIEQFPKVPSRLPDVLDLGREAKEIIIEDDYNAY